MTLVHGDGFDHYGSAANMLGVWAVASGNIVDGSTPGIGQAPRTGSNCYYHQGALQYTFAAPTDEVIIGFAMWKNDLPGDDQRSRVFEFAGTPGNPGTYSCVLTINANQGFTLWQGYFGATVASAALLWGLSQWNYIEVSLNTTTQTLIVRVNNAVVWTYSGPIILAQNIGAAYSNAFAGGSSNFWMDDYYIVDPSGAQPNTFCNSIRARTFYPASDNLSQDWTPSVGSDGFACVDNSPPNDSVFVTSLAGGDVSSFGMIDTPPNTNAIYGLVVYARNEKSDNGGASMRVNMSNVNGTENGVTFNPNTTFTFASTTFGLDPGGFFWDRQLFNGSAVEIERIS